MMNKPSNTGGAAAIRGFLVQTLVALLDIIEADPPFIEITLEPAGVNDQFDFVWRNADKRVAVQVKSSITPFSKTEVEQWAIALQGKSTTEQCELILVGDCRQNMSGFNQHGVVTIKRRSLNTNGLFEQAAFRVFQFMHQQNQAGETPDAYLMIVDSLVGRLLHYSTTREPLPRAQFIKLMMRCVKEAPGKPQPDDIAIPIDIDRITRYAPQHLIGREDDTALLASAWQQACAGENPRPHIISFVALGGEGKTALVADWVAQQTNWPDCEAAFAWSFYSQGSDQQAAASSDLFIHAALQFFGEATLAASAQSGVDKARRLAQVVGEQRALLILDGVEPLQCPPTGAMHGALRDQALAQLLRGLAGNNLGLCVLTTRYPIPNLNKQCWSDSVKEHTLRRLSNEAGVALLGALKVHGAPAECAKLVESVQGHALSIQLFGSYLRDAHSGDIRKRDRVQLADANAQELGGHAFRVMDAYVGWFGSEEADTEIDADTQQRGQTALALLRLLGLFDRPADAGCLAALWQGPVIRGLTDALFRVEKKWLGLRRIYHPLDIEQINLALTRLEGAKLLTMNRDGGGNLVTVDAHPLLREYFAHRLSTGQKEAWQAAHRRLYTYLCENTEDKQEPTVDDLQPLYQAVAHGCLAGMQQQACDDVYNTRIEREEEFYSTRKLGAFGTDLGAVACFFDQPWQRISPVLSEDAKAWMVNNAAFNLRALGRLTDAAEPMQTGLAMRVKQENWKSSAIIASNLSELELTLGDLAGAVRDAEQAVSHADRSGDAFQRMARRTTHADALHQSGRADIAMALFCEAEAMQAEMQPAYPLLYSLPGFRYCELLLAAPQACAWRCSVQNCFNPLAVAALGQAQTCQLVTQRAAQTLAWMEQSNMSLLDIALDHLTLGRATLFAAILAGQPLAPCHASLKLAVDGLRRSGNMDDLPRGLLTRAWLFATTCHHTGPDSAQTDLEEAWEIAEAGPMPLFMADIHLHRAGLFHHITPYPWQSPAVDAREARRLIEKHGYLRRMEDLAAVEQAIAIKG